MTSQPTVTPHAVEEFLGDVAPLAEHVGSAEGLVALSGAAFNTSRASSTVTGFSNSALTATECAR